MELTRMLEFFKTPKIGGERDLLAEMMDSQSYFAYTVISAEDVVCLPILENAFRQKFPQARVVVASVPPLPTRKSDPLRNFYTALLESIGEPAPARRKATTDLELHIPFQLNKKADFLIVDNAERLTNSSLHFLGRNREFMPPVILVGRSQKLINNIRADVMIYRQAIYFDYTKERLVTEVTEVE